MLARDVALEVAIVVAELRPCGHQLLREKRNSSREKWTDKNKIANDSYTLGKKVTMAGGGYTFDIQRR